MHVGVTGHQRLNGVEGWSWVARALKEQLSAIEPPLVAVTSLAIGADQLLAKLVLECGGKIHVILPFADVERSFAARDLPAYRELVAQATHKEVLKVGGTDEDAFLAAGHRVVDLSDIVIAIWDGLPAKGKGGTGDIVDYAKSRKKRLVLINPVSRTVERSPREPKNWV